MVRVRIGNAVMAALKDGVPVVALETAVLTHGLPRSPLQAPPCCTEFLDGARPWDARGPANLELARAMAQVVALGGAVPATVGMLKGELVIGLDDHELAALGQAERPVKLSTRDLAGAAIAGDHGGTTVAGTLAAIAIANRRAPAPIRVFATGGIGGVHRGWTERPDVSADLLALARTPVCVVSAGAKSILDLPATVEALDSLGVPVLGLTTRWFPRFLSGGAAPLAVQREVASIDQAARIALAHWSLVTDAGGVLLANPPPERWALGVDELEATIARLVREAHAAHVSAADVTPHLLASLAHATGGRSVDANVAALLHNARVAARLAACMATDGIAPRGRES